MYSTCFTSFNENAFIAIGVTYYALLYVPNNIGLYYMFKFKFKFSRLKLYASR